MTAKHPDWDLYFGMNRWVRLHVTPSGGTVTIHLPQDDPRAQRPRSALMANLNTTARELLRLCDGTLTLGQIVHRLIEQEGGGDDQQTLDGILTFVSQAIEYEILSTHAEPFPTQIQVSGSTNYRIPQAMSIELVSGCNLRCIYCYRDAGSPTDDHLTDDKLLDILEDMVKQGLEVVELTGGEPLLHPAFLRIVEFCATHFKLVAVLSNGCLINSHIARRLADCGSRVCVQVDLDGPKAEIHDYLRGVPGAFERVKRGIRFLTEYGVQTRVIMNVVPDTLSYVEDTLKLSRDLGATWFHFAPVLGVGRGAELNLTYTLEQAQYLANLQEELHSKYGSFLPISPELVRKLTPQRNCGAGHRSVTLGPTGRVRSCPMLPEQYLMIGDLTTQTVEEVFSNPVVEFLHNLESPQEETCDGCDYSAECRYCIARAVLRQAKLERPCRWAQENTIDEWFTLDSLSTGGTSCNVAHLCNR